MRLEGEAGGWRVGVGVGTRLVRRSRLEVEALPAGEEDLVPEDGRQHEQDDACRRDARREVCDRLKVGEPLLRRLVAHQKVEPVVARVAVAVGVLDAAEDCVEDGFHLHATVE